MSKSEMSKSKKARERVMEGEIPRGHAVLYITSVAFTHRARELSERVRQAWEETARNRREIIVWRESKKLTESIFSASDALLFFCASGIAVRMAAPFLKDKTSDPAILVIGEDGRFVISLVSGHLGGANRYALRIAELLHAQPVITTATDGRNMAAPDVWAQKYRLSISDMKLAKRMTSYLLNRGDSPLKKTEAEEIPFQLNKKYYICIADKEQQEKIREGAGRGEEILFMEPKKYVVGIGCRRETEYEKMEAFIRDFLTESGIEPSLVSRICSIDLKAGEDCIKRTARALKAEFTVFSKENLLSAIGDFSSSDFVRRTVGVDNVCERSALLGALEDVREAAKQPCGKCDDGGEKEDSAAVRLAVKKTVRQGMTAAAAVRSVCRKPVLLTIEDWEQQTAQRRAEAAQRSALKNEKAQAPTSASTPAK